MNVPNAPAMRGRRACASSMYASAGDARPSKARNRRDDHREERDRPQRDVHMILEPPPGVALGHIAQTEHHALLHHEVHRLEDGAVEGFAPERSVRRAAAAHEQPRRHRAGWHEFERPTAVFRFGEVGSNASRTKAERPAGFVHTKRRESHAAGFVRGVHPEPVADRPLLAIGPADIFGRHLAADEVFEQIEAVEAAAILTQLREPRPHVFGGGLNRDDARLTHRRVGHDRVARHRPASLFVGRAPAQVPRPDVDQCHREQEREGTGKRGQTFHGAHRHSLLQRAYRYERQRGNEAKGQ